MRTPSCKPFSEFNPAWTHRDRAVVLADLHCALNYVRMHKPHRVVIENLTTEDVLVLLYLNPQKVVIMGASLHIGGPLYGRLDLCASW